MLNPPAKQEIDAYLDGEEIADLTPEKLAARRKAYIDAFCAQSPAERELALFDYQDSPWTAADRARMAELKRIIAAQDED